MKRLSVIFCTLLYLFIGTTSLGIGAYADLVNKNGRLYYYDINQREAARIGIDVSFYNNQVDWEAVRAQGIDFAIIRIGGRGWGTGRLYGDRQTQIYLRGAREAGLDIGVYFYSTARNSAEAVEEAESALAALNGMKLDFPIFIDMEYSGDYPNGRADSLNPAVRAEIAEAFCTTVEAAGYASGIYAGQGYFKYDLDTASISYLPRWLASYTVNNLLPDYDKTYEIWQFTDSGYFGGIDGPVDLNLIFP